MVGTVRPVGGWWLAAGGWPRAGFVPPLGTDPARSGRGGQYGVVTAEPQLRDELAAGIERTWYELGGAGAHWNAADRLAIARVTRAARVGHPLDPTPLPPAAAEAAGLLSATPSRTSEEWVTGICEQIGETRYVELVGIVARVSAVDTLHRLLGWELRPLPQPRPGEPSGEPVPEGARRNRTWVSMEMPSPPFVLGAVPSAMKAMVELSDLLYMPMAEMADPDWRRGDLHRTQVELVATSTSHVNECFY